MSAWRDPWKVAVGLVVLVGGLALLFPKPERTDDEETDIPDLRVAPPGASEALLAEPAEIRCLRDGDATARDGCRLLGVEAPMIYHLAARWDLSDLQRRASAFTVTDARIELRENHEEQYSGPVTIAAVPASGDLSAALAGPSLAAGDRISTRTIRVPLSGPAEDLDALVAGWLNGDVPNRGVLVRVDPAQQSSVDEYTPTLSFFYTEAPRQ